MRNYNLLWGIWAIWALLVAVWLMDIYSEFPLRYYGHGVVALHGRECRDRIFLYC
ncbi:hypothetical protein R0L47_20940 [Pectobacterium polonicum]|uniref:hypothetical protein n=1 Tax=Pectobacterium polonicum TaxID=2485124 RepID=UPI003754C3ED